MTETTNPRIERALSIVERDVASEFGEGIACVLAGPVRLTPAHYRTILRAARQSREERSEFLTILERERTSLEELDTRLSEVELRLFELSDAPAGSPPPDGAAVDPDDLLELEATCDRLASHRQERIHNRSLSRISGIGGASLVTYLYGDCDATCPALADVLDVLADVKRLRRRAEHGMDG